MKDQVSIFGVNINKIGMDSALGQIEKWVKSSGKYYVVTPNIEFLMAAREDNEFKDILNKANLAIPDSARFGWALTEIYAKNPLKKIALWLFFLFPKASFLMQFPVVTGTDLMEKLITLSAEKGFTVGFLGGKDGVAEYLKECLEKKYPKLKISYAESGGQVNMQGEIVPEVEIPKTDILFLAFGQVKQEKWISKNLSAQPVKVMIGVGGAFDYLSGMVPRAPQPLRNLGFEWLYRVILQPWRIKRFVLLLKFIFLILLGL